MLNITSVQADHNIYHSDTPQMIVPIIEVIDGDTIRTAVSLPQPLNKLSIRILGIDTPESTWRAKCVKERELGIFVKDFVKSMFKDSKLMILTNYKYGKYGGRILADVNIDGISVKDLLISKGYAKLYDGKQKPSWCE